MLRILLFFSGCCSETEVSEQLYLFLDNYKKKFYYKYSLIYGDIIMTRKERLLNLIQGKKADRCAVSFSCHFGPDQRAGEAEVNAHLDFLEQSNVDICKVMNENQLRGSCKFEKPSDLRHIAPSFSMKKNIAGEVELTARLVDAVGADTPVIVTIHSPFVSVQHMSGRPGFFVQNFDFYRQCLLEDPSAMREALKTAAGALCELVRGCLEAGADGIFLAVLGSQKQLMNDEQYADVIRPFDLEVLEAAKGGINILHLCGQNLAVRRFTDYPASIVNWEFGDDNPGITEGFALFGPEHILMGGLSSSGGALLNKGDTIEVEKEVHRVLQTVGPERFILGAGCTLPTGVDPGNLRAAVRACGTFAVQ
jgi:uroporphyrinogen decarboxylase